jgi:predicted Zn finger-like uncharacterized protein
MIIIVNCEKCGSRLKVDDAKIPDTGIMARCSFCSHRFHLKKGSENKDSGAESTIWPEDGSTSAKPAQEKIETPERIDAPRPAEPSASREGFEMLERLRNREVAKAAPAVPPPPPEAQKAAAGWDFTSFFPDGEQAGKPSAPPLKSEPAPEVRRPVEPLKQEAVSPPAAVREFAPHAEPVTSSPERRTGPEPSAYAKQPVQPPTVSPPVESREFAPQPVAKEPDMIITEPRPAAMSMSGSSAERAYSVATEQIQQPPPVDRAPYTPQSSVPEIVTDDRRIPSLASLQQPREIVSVLDSHGMNDEYLVRAVKDVCEATRFVEGVEKPDWPTRLLGLDMLARIRGVYPMDKKDDPAKRQLQIVTGINV